MQNPVKINIYGVFAFLPDTNLYTDFIGRGFHDFLF